MWPPMSSEAAAATARGGILGRYRGLVTPGEPCDFEYGGFPTPDGMWTYREPDSVVVVEHDRLRVAAIPLTRSHDRVQILDNAKNMLFSRRRIIVPADGEMRVSVEMRARVVRGDDDDLYAGFVSINLLDFESGLALDWFAASRTSATVYARLRFPVVTAEPLGDDPSRPRWFCVFNECGGPLAAWELHRYEIAYDPGAAVVRWLRDGIEVDRHEHVPVRATAFTVALGIMTEKPLGEGGSTSLRGQGVAAEWSEIEVTGADLEALPDPA